MKSSTVTRHTNNKQESKHWQTKRNPNNNVQGGEHSVEKIAENSIGRLKNL
jgi:hypothetical protein